MNANDTIYALSSGLLPSAIAIVRISGSRAQAILELLAGAVPVPRMARLVTLRAHDGEMIDEAIALFFSGPHSDTGEDVAELHVHGGRAVVAKVFAELSRMEGVRPAERGEFTQRSVFHGKRDLTAAEGLLDLINADTQAQRRLGLRHLQGLLGERATSWRKQLLDASALIMAAIDFSDEDDVRASASREAMHVAERLRDEIESVLSAQHHAERLRDGLVVAIVGPPNAGKSTLLNRLARREVAIVSPHAGTTRDVIEVALDLGGYPVTLLDTAGLRESADPVEQEGIRRARARAGEADLVLWLTGPMTEPGGNTPAPAVFNESPVWEIRTMIDLPAGTAGTPMSDTAHAISAKTGAGMSELLIALQHFAQQFFATSEDALVVRERHRVLLGQARDALSRIRDAAALGDEFVAEELRLATQALGKLLGHVDVEDVLDVVFREFCIGK